MNRYISILFILLAFSFVNTGTALAGDAVSDFEPAFLKTIPLYFKNRALDLFDIVEIKVGLGVGLHFDAEATDLLHMGYGLGIDGLVGWEGRHLSGSAHIAGGFPVTNIISRALYGPGEGTISHIHIEFNQIDEESKSDACFMFMPWTKNNLAESKPFLKRFDIEAGATICPFAVRIGIRLGEIIDFIAGIFFLDPMGDDLKYTGQEEKEKTD